MQRQNLKRKTVMQRKINPSDCNFKQIENQNLFLNWGIFAENFPEEILQDLHSSNPDEAVVNIRKSHLYKERLYPNDSRERIGLGHRPTHLVDFHDVPDSNFTDRMDATWYQMDLSIPGANMEQNPHHNDLFEACVIREVSGTLLDNDDNPFSYPRKEKLNLTGKAMVGLNVNDVDWLQLFDPIQRKELEKMFFKLKIYACHDLDDALYGE